MTIANRIIEYVLMFSSIFKITTEFKEKNIELFTYFNLFKCFPILFIFTIFLFIYKYIFSISQIKKYIIRHQIVDRISN
jgi:hypothetical protein